MNSNSVSVIDGFTNEVIDTIKVGDSPWKVAVNPDNGTVYVANAKSNDISVIQEVD